MKCLCGCNKETLPNNKYINGHVNKGKKFTEEHCKNLSLSKKGKKLKPHSEETKNKISESNKGKTSKQKGKTYEEIYGITKANELKEIKRNAILGKKHFFYGNKHAADHLKTWWIGKKHSEETKLKMKESSLGNKNSMYGKDHSGSKGGAWKGGGEQYWHEKAWKLFGKDYCEHCNISLVEYKRIKNKRFDMHNTCLPKDYSNLEENSWLCLCNVCHLKLEHIFWEKKKG